MRSSDDRMITRMRMPTSAPRSNKTQKMNIDILTKELRIVDAANYDHPNLFRVMKHLGALEPHFQDIVVKTAIDVDMTYEDLLEHVRAQFIILKQNDEEGKYCGLGFGEKCTSVATWNDWEIPEHAADVDITKICYADADGNLRCGHLLDFAELWMDVNNASFQEFLDGIVVEEHGELDV